MSGDPITVGAAGKVVWIKVLGKGSFENASRLKTLAFELINRGSREFVIDLEECSSMDSTFMGTLTGIAQRLFQLGQGGIHVIHLNPHTRELLSNLGLDQLFDVQEDLSIYKDPENMEAESAAASAGQESPEALDRRAQAKLMYEAHLALSDISAENAAKFKDVLDFLRQDLGKNAEG